jgi:hypothetical protein
MILYNCKHDGDQYRITKFDEHQNVESSYLCTTEECECPAGHRRQCRHREMLPLFIRRGAINSGWQLDYDRGGWVQMYEDTPVLTSEGIALPDEARTIPAEPMPPLPEGVQMLTLDDPLALHNAIAEAIGEPEAVIPTTEWHCPKCGAQADERFDCCEVQEATDNITATEIAERFAELQGPAPPVVEYMVDRTLEAVQALTTASATPTRKSWRRF